MQVLKNIIIENLNTKSFLADAYYLKSDEKLPLVVFLHGYKGYKDWGAWDLMAKKIAEKGFYVVTFNTSHNGTTLDSPNEFGDLESFGQNNYSKELSDLRTVIDFFSKKEEVDENYISIIGHSRGGGLTIIEAFENNKVKALITLASVSTLHRFPKGNKLKEWKEKGVFYVKNGRTNQDMPHYYQFFEDYELNQNRLNVNKAVAGLQKPFLIIHGSADEAVELSNAKDLHNWSSTSEFVILEGAKHTFGAKEPLQNEKLPPELQKATDIMIDFLLRNLRS